MLDMEYSKKKIARVGDKNVEIVTTLFRMEDYEIKKERGQDKHPAPFLKSNIL